MCNVATCWIYEYIGILLGIQYILHISRIRVNCRFNSELKCKVYIQNFREFFLKSVLNSNIELHNSCHIDFMTFTIQANVLEVAECKKTKRKCDI
jgi:hypothetical protein